MTGEVVEGGALIRPHLSPTCHQINLGATQNTAVSYNIINISLTRLYDLVLTDPVL